MTAGVDNGVATLVKLERGQSPEPAAGIEPAVSLASIAISLKRIADYMHDTRSMPKNVRITTDSEVKIRAG